MRSISVVLLTVAAVDFSMACERTHLATTLTGPSTSASAISVSIITDRQLIVGQTTALRAVAAMSDGSTRDISREAVWQSSNSVVCVIQTGGAVIPMHPGICDITATFDTISTTGSFFAVMDSWNGEIISIEVLGPRTMTAGEGARYIVIGNMADGSHPEVTERAAFESGDSSVADIDRDGRVAALGEGSTTITVTISGLQVAFRLTVLPSSPTVRPQPVF